MSRCNAWHNGRFNDGIREILSPDGEYIDLNPYNRCSDPFVFNTFRLREGKETRGVGKPSKKHKENKKNSTSVTKKNELVQY